MREIKFRAWDKVNSKIVNVYSFCERTIKFIEKIEDTKDLELNFIHREPIKDFELMQYTGLKDNNGVEIYEGDILAFYEDEQFTAYGAVRYGNNNNTLFSGMYFLCDKNGYSTDFAFEDDGKPEYWGSLEVIGNIYENPELIEVKEDE